MPPRALAASAQRHRDRPRRACRRPRWRMARRRWSRAPARRWPRRWRTSTPRWRVGANAAAARRAAAAAGRAARRRPDRGAQAAERRTPTPRPTASARGSRWPARRRAWCCSAHGGRRLADTLRRPGPSRRARSRCARGTERIVAIGQGARCRRRRRSRAAPGLRGLARRHADALRRLRPPPSAPAAWCTPTGERLALHRERLDAGWVSGAELARGVSTVTHHLRRRAAHRGDRARRPGRRPATRVDGRQLLLGLDGATRALDARRRARRAPVLLAMDNRSVLAYDVVPDAASQRRWW